LIKVLSSILVLYSSLVASLLLLFLFLIGRFYEVRFGQRSYYQIFIVPLVLYLGAAVWDAFFANDYTGDPLLDFVGAWGPNLLWLSGGIALGLLCFTLYRTMMGGRR